MPPPNQLRTPLSGQGAGQGIQQQQQVQEDCCQDIPGPWKWKCCFQVTLQTACLGPFMERSPMDWAGFRLEVQIPRVTRFSVSGLARVGVRGFVSVQERCRLRCEGGQVTRVSPCA